MAPRFLLVIGAIALGSSANCSPATSWIELKEDRYIVDTDAGEKAARQVVTRLQQIDEAFDVLGSVSRDLGPLRVYLFASESEFATYRASPWQAGMTSVAPTQAPAVLLYQSPRVESVVSHEYAHVLIKQGHWKLPNWFEEGFAELCSNAEIRPHSLVLGKAIPQHLTYLLDHRQIERLLPFSTAPRREDQPEGYYAASWALVHMLHFDKRFRGGLGPLVQLLLEGTAANEAFVHVYGRSTIQVLEDLSMYIGNPGWPGQTFERPPGLTSQRSASRAKVMNPVESRMMLADLLLDVGQADAAARAFRRVSREHPGEPTGEEALGLVALATGETQAAIRHLHIATTTMHSRSARAWLELAFLERDRGSGWASTVKPLLERAAELDSGDFRANYVLGVRESDSGLTGEAVRHLARAAEIAPDRADVWHAYSIALIGVGRILDAEVAAKRGARVARSVEEERMMVGVLGLIESNRAPNSRAGSEVTISPTWNSPQPDTFVTGGLVYFDCAAQPARMKVESDGKLLTINVGDPKSVQMINAAGGAASMEFSCGAQDGRPVRVGYLQSSNTVLSVEFLQVRRFPPF
jgi:tetratricopeptide (TPR) repeat protein